MEIYGTLNRDFHIWTWLTRDSGNSVWACALTQTETKPWHQQLDLHIWQGCTKCGQGAKYGPGTNSMQPSGSFLNCISNARPTVWNIFRAGKELSIKWTMTDRYGQLHGHKALTLMDTDNSIFGHIIWIIWLMGKKWTRTGSGISVYGHN